MCVSMCARGRTQVTLFNVVAQHCYEMLRIDGLDQFGAGISTKLVLIRVRNNSLTHYICSTRDPSTGGVQRYVVLFGFTLISRYQWIYRTTLEYNSVSSQIRIIKRKDTCTMIDKLVEIQRHRIRKSVHVRRCDQNISKFG